MKRQDYLSWDEFFMGVALLASQRSKDPNTQVGACIVDNNNKIVSTGYNGAPIGYDDDHDMNWSLREGAFLDVKYTYICHAELNAILNAPMTVRGSRIYVALFPCNECAKAIIQSGIKEVIYACDKYKDTDSVIASKKMFDKCGIKYRMFESRGKNINLKI